MRQRIESIVANYANGAGRNFELLKRTPAKRINNFLKKTNISDPDEIIAFLDTSVLGSGKEGIALCEERVVWQNVIFNGGGSIKYEDLDKVRFTKKIGDVLLVQTAHGNQEMTFSRREIPNKTLVEIFSAIEQVCSEDPQEEGGEECEFLNSLIRSEENYFRTLQEKLQRQHKVSSVGRHLGSMFDVLFAVSKEEENNAHRRNPSQENAAEKKQLQAVNMILTPVLNFGKHINREGRYNRSFQRVMKNELVSFELLIWASCQATALLERVGLARDVIDSVVSYLFDPIFNGYFSYKISNQNKPKRLADVVSPTHGSEQVSYFQEVIRNFGEFSREEGDECVNYFLFKGVLYGAVNRETTFDKYKRLGKYEDNENVVGSEANNYHILEEVYGEDLFESVCEFREQFELHVEKVLMRVLEDLY